MRVLRARPRATTVRILFAPDVGDVATAPRRRPRVVVFAAVVVFVVPGETPRTRLRVSTVTGLDSARRGHLPGLWKGKPGRVPVLRFLYCSPGGGASSRAAGGA